MTTRNEELKATMIPIVERPRPRGYVRRQLWDHDLMAYRDVDIPIIPDIATRVLTAATQTGCRLHQPEVHACKSAHCAGGWAVLVAGLSHLDESFRKDGGGFSALDLAEELFKAAGHAEAGVALEGDRYVAAGGYYFGAHQGDGERCLMDCAIAELNGEVKPLRAE